MGKDSYVFSFHSASDLDSLLISLEDTSAEGRHLSFSGSSLLRRI